MSAGSEAAPQITVAVVSWNTRDLLSRCLDAFAPDSASGIAEIWVVDNASSDGSAEMVRADYPWVRLIASDRNLGFGAAVNLVAGATSSPWIAPANADIRPAPGALSNLLQAAERAPRAGAVAPQLILPDGTVQHSVLPFPTVPFTVAYLLGLNRVSERLGRRWCLGRGFDPSEERDVPWAVGAFLLVRRSAWTQVGGFDEAQWMYAEDLDLGWRLARDGWTTRYIPSARIFHDESSATTRAWAETRYARWHRSTYAWLLRRRGLSYARTVSALNVCGFLLRYVALLPLSRVSHRGRLAREAAFNAARAHSVGLRPRDFLARVR